MVPQEIMPYVCIPAFMQCNYESGRDTSIFFYYTLLIHTDNIFNIVKMVRLQVKNFSFRNTTLEKLHFDQNRLYKSVLATNLNVRLMFSTFDDETKLSISIIKNCLILRSI